MCVDDRCPECGALVWEQRHEPPTSGFAIASLVLGIVSIVSCFGIGPFAIVPAVLGIIFGEIASRQHKRHQRAGATFGMALAGRICACIGLALGLVFVAIVILPRLGYW